MWVLILKLSKNFIMKVTFFFTPTKVGFQLPYIGYGNSFSLTRSHWFALQTKRWFSSCLSPWYFNSTCGLSDCHKYLVACFQVHDRRVVLGHRKRGVKGLQQQRPPFLLHTLLYVHSHDANRYAYQPHIVLNWRPCPSMLVHQGLLAPLNRLFTAKS